MSSVVRGIGVDLVDVNRFAAALARRRGLAGRLFAETELAYANTAASQATTDARLAVRFAAKEAVMKALGVGIGSMRFADVTVERQPDGQPSLRLVGTAAAVASKAGVSSWLLSLSHTDGVAVAVAVAQ